MKKTFARRRDLSDALSKALGKKGIFRIFGFLSAKRMVKNNIKKFEIDQLHLVAAGRCYRIVSHDPWIEKE